MGTFVQQPNSQKCHFKDSIVASDKQKWQKWQSANYPKPEITQKCNFKHAKIAQIQSLKNGQNSQKTVS